MQPQVEITTKDGIISVKTPYSVRLLPTYRQKGGKFNRTTKAWEYPDVKPIRDWLKEFFGWYEGAGIKNITIDRSHIDHDDEGGRAEYLLEGYGYIIAHRSGRDAPAIVDDGCMLTQGEFGKSGGSVKHPSMAGSEVIQFYIAVWDGLELKEGEAEGK